MIEQENKTEGVSSTDTVLIPKDLYDTLCYLGIIIDETKVREYHVGESNYSKSLIQPWTIWLAYPELTSWDHDIIKRILRTKKGESRETEYNKIIHICKERLRQLHCESEFNQYIENLPCN